MLLLRAAVAAAMQLADIYCQILEIKAALQVVTDDNTALREEVASLKQTVETPAVVDAQIDIIITREEGELWWETLQYRETQTTIAKFGL